MAPRHWRCLVWLVLLTTLALGTGPAALHGVCGREREAVPMEIIRETGEWRCVEIPGFLIYTRLPDAHSRAFADEVRRHNLVLAALRPEDAPFRSTSNQVPVVLRVSPPLGGLGGRRPPLPVQAYDDEVALMYVVHVPALVPVSSEGNAGGGIGSGFPGSVGAPSPINPAVVVGGPPAEAERLARDAFARRLRYSHPAPPEWLLHGMDRLMQETRILGATLQIGAAQTRPAVPLGPIEEIFTADFGAADELQHEALMRQSALFLRWTLVAEPERRGSLWDFAGRVARAPATEAVFDQCFAMSYGELGVVLTDSRLRRGRVDAAPPGFTSSEVRTANAEEVERLLRTIEGLNERTSTHNAGDIAVN